MNFQFKNGDRVHLQGVTSAIYVVLYSYVTPLGKEACRIIIDGPNGHAFGVYMNKLSLASSIGDIET